MRLKELKSLLWLSRWYNGRSQRIEDCLQRHLGVLGILVIQELGSIPAQATDLNIYGFELTITHGPLGLEVLAMTAPEVLSGEQLALFAEEEELTVLSLQSELPWAA